MDNFLFEKLAYQTILLCSLKLVHILSLMNFENPMLAYQMAVLFPLFSTSNRK